MKKNPNVKTDPKEYLNSLKNRKVPEGITDVHQDFVPTNSFAFWQKPENREDGPPIRIFFDDPDEFWKLDYFENALKAENFSHFEITGRVLKAYAKSDRSVFMIGVFDYPIVVPERFCKK